MSNLEHASDTNEMPEAKRPYHAPTLKRLGSVRELTLGTTGKGNEGLPQFFSEDEK